MYPFRAHSGRGQAYQANKQNVIVLSQNGQNLQNRQNATSTTTDSSVAASAAADLVVAQIMQETDVQNQHFHAKNTNDAYNPRVDEYKTWCDNMYHGASIETQYTVTEGKLVAFLQMAVINRANKHTDKEIGLATVKAYKNAIVDLYKKQVSQKVNSHPHPGMGKTIQELMKSCRRDKVDRMKRNYEDRGREGFRMKSFSVEQLHAINDFHMMRKKMFMKHYVIICRNSTCDRCHLEEST